MDAGEDPTAEFHEDVRGSPWACACRGCGEYVEVAQALTCCNWRHRVRPSGAAAPFPSCRSVYHVECYRASETEWPTVLTAASHSTRGRGARVWDVRTRRFLCEICRVRAQCGHLAEDAAGDRARKLERLRIFTLWASSLDGTIKGIASARKRLVDLDAALPRGCPLTVKPFAPFWPLPQQAISLQWHQLSLYTWGGMGEGGLRSAEGLKELRTAMFSEFRERAFEDPLCMASAGGLAHVDGAAPTDGVMNERFVRGLMNTLGGRCVQADPMPPSVARALERMYERMIDETRSVWGRYALAAAALANVLLYSCFLRGDEPWKIKYSSFQKQPYINDICPRCGHRHLVINIGERTKTSNVEFDVVCAVPTTGAGLHSSRVAARAIRLRGQVGQLLNAIGLSSDDMFVREDGKRWANPDYWKEYGLPGLRQLQAQRHPGLTGIDLKDVRRNTIRMYRRGGETFVMKTDVKPDLVDLMGRWRTQERERMPTIMRQRYYGMSCEDGYAVTSAAPPRTHIGFCAWFSFEPCD